MPLTRSTLADGEVARILAFSDQCGNVWNAEAPSKLVKQSACLRVKPLTKDFDDAVRKNDAFDFRRLQTRSFGRCVGDN